MSKHALALRQRWKHSKIDFEMVGGPLAPAPRTLPGPGESFIFKQTWWAVLIQVAQLPFFLFPFIFFLFLPEDGPGGGNSAFLFCVGFN